MLTRNSVYKSLVLFLWPTNHQVIFCVLGQDWIVHSLNSHTMEAPLPPSTTCSLSHVAWVTSTNPLPKARCCWGTGTGTACWLLPFLAASIIFKCSLSTRCLLIQVPLFMRQANASALSSCSCLQGCDQGLEGDHLYFQHLLQQTGFY